MSRRVLTLTRMLSSAAAAVLVSLASAPALAQSAATLQRCESPDGKVTYANIACPDGTRAVRAVPPASAPSAEDARAARERLKADQQQVQKIDKARAAGDAQLQRERAAQARQAADRERACRKLAARVRQAEETLSRAALAKRETADRQLQKARAQYAADCGK
jgi:hypothetical protein